MQQTNIILNNLSKDLSKFYSYKEGVKGVILDWAGTAVDYGCMAPTMVFIEVFRKHGIEITIDEARGPMGLHKLDHTKELLKLDSVINQWKNRYDRVPDDDDANRIYEDLEPMLFEVIKNHSKPIPGLLDFVDSMHELGIKVGSTTGYTTSMMDVLKIEAEKHGYCPDNIVCSNEVPRGRPSPLMCYKNAIDLDIFPLKSIIKIGDTPADIKEGLNAGMITIGITKTGNEIGLTQEDANKLDRNVLDEKISHAEQKLLNAGANFIIEGIWEAKFVIREIDAKIKAGEL